MILTFDVKNQIINRTDNNRVVADSKNYLYVSFDFTDDWTGNKTAVFQHESDVAREQLLGDNNTCSVPSECIKKGELCISCFCGDLITANKIYINIEESGLVDGKTPEPETPDIYNQILTAAETAKKEADSVVERANNGEFNGAPGPRGEKGDKGDPGTTDYLELKNVPFQPVPEPSGPTEVLRIPQDLEPGTYVFTSGDLSVDFCGGIIHPSEGELLYITCPYPFKHNQAVFFNSNGVTFTVGSEQDGEYIYDSKTVNADTINNIELLYQMMDLISTWLVPLFNVSPGQAVTVENADMANLTLELSGMDLPTELPSPNALTIKIGGESVVYDGSSAQTIEIADGNEVAY